MPGQRHRNIADARPDALILLSQCALACMMYLGKKTRRLACCSTCWLHLQVVIRVNVRIHMTTDIGNSQGILTFSLNDDAWQVSSSSVW